MPALRIVVGVSFTLPVRITCCIGSREDEILGVARLEALELHLEHGNFLILLQNDFSENISLVANARRLFLLFTDF